MGNSLKYSCFKEMGDKQGSKNSSNKVDQPTNQLINK